MAENRENPSESVRTLNLLVQQNGAHCVAEALQVSEDALRDLRDGNVEMDDATEADLGRLCESVESGLEFIGSVGAGPADDTPAIVGVDLDGDGEYDVELAGVEMVAPTQSWGEEIERKRISLRSAKALALISQFRLGVKYQESVAALGLVTQIELALISFFPGVGARTRRGLGRGEARPGDRTQVGQAALGGTGAGEGIRGAERGLEPVGGPPQGERERAVPAYASGGGRHAGADADGRG